MEKRQKQFIRKLVDNDGQLEKGEFMREFAARLIEKQCYPPIPTLVGHLLNDLLDDVDQAQTQVVQSEEGGAENDD